MMKNYIRTYTELSNIKNFDDRFRYLKLNGNVCEETFGSDRYLNQMLYNSSEWRQFRNSIIVRDNGFDLGCDGYDIYGKILIHHINPIRKSDILNRDPMIFDPENVVCVSFDTHNAIHYGDESVLDIMQVVERTKNDTCPWK